MKSNRRYRINMKSETIVNKSVWSSPKPMIDFGERGLVDIGLDSLPFYTSEGEHKDVFNNNFYCSNEMSMVEAFDSPAFRVFKMHKLIARDPQVKQICLDEQNSFFASRYISYRFNTDNVRSDEELHLKAMDFKYIIDCCGSHLKILNVEADPYFPVMPFINTKCPNLTELILRLKKFEDEDFENVFSNLFHLEVLRINWQCEYSSLPLTLVKSLKQVGGTLKELCLSCGQNKKYLCLPDSLSSIFPQLITLEKLNIIDFGLSQSLLQSIGEITDLVHLRIMCSWLNNDPEFNKQINMRSIGHLEYLETLCINFDCGVTDRFLINLCDNAKILRHLEIIGKNITDYGMLALNNLRKLETLKFNLNGSEENVFITDQSIRWLALRKLEYLDLSNCIEITNRSMLKLFENLPSLNILYIRNTNVTLQVAGEILELTKHHKKPMYVYVSFENRDGMFQSLASSGVFFKSNFNTPKYINILL